MLRGRRPIRLLFALSAWAVSAVWGAPTLLEHVQGYTLAANRLETFTGLVFDTGKVLEAGDAAPKGPISDVFNLLKRESGPSLTIEEIGERTADGWAGDR